MKAYTVTSDYSEFTEIIYAESPAKAKGMAITGDCLHDTDFTDLQCRRFKEMDDESIKTPKVLEWNEETQRKCRLLGWHEVDGDGACEDCGLESMSQVPESQLNDDGVCGECQPMSPCCGEKLDEDVMLCPACKEHC